MDIFAETVAYCYGLMLNQILTINQSRRFDLHWASLWQSLCLLSAQSLH